MFVYCLNNPVMYIDDGGTWPSLSKIFAAVAVVAVAVAVAVAATAVAVCVATAGAAAPAMVAVGSTIVNTAAIASTATTVAKVSLAAAFVAKKVEQQTKSYTIYCLKNDKEQVVYAGRTCDFDRRMKEHKCNPNRTGLKPEILASDLTYGQARSLEQFYIAYYLTLDKTNKAKNQINGVNPKRKDFYSIMGQGFGLNEALDSMLTNYLLDLIE